MSSKLAKIQMHIKYHYNTGNNMPIKLMRQNVLYIRNTDTENQTTIVNECTDYHTKPNIIQ